MPRVRIRVNMGVRVRVRDRIGSVKGTQIRVILRVTVRVIRYDLN